MLRTQNQSDRDETDPLSTEPGFTFKVLTLNAHKGFAAFNRRFILPELREAVRTVGPDIVFLQEVLGAHEKHSRRFHNWPIVPQYEFLADTLWKDFAYGRNAVYPDGDHGNALLSRFPIASYQNLDVSVAGTEKRGMLHCIVHVPGRRAPLHLICVHLGLKERHRREQLSRISRYIATLPRHEPLVVAGDFNDWRQQANRLLGHETGLEEVFTKAYGRPARTFPARFPLLRLDRIYVRNARISRPASLANQPWSRLSDHAPLAVEIHL
ncbi:endonuclease/exonuclease/phosphatase family protein [Martelella alba]|uniref:Endonuclease/exonuclease/phosphatase family protein n=1 Tax=Martelella alba TaxID=2590451 RepID=A0ABY2SJM1_9HYPH|nr:endonuclease/exonuclease/phosphatase family protein [Martelella alba]TKI05097.1 endonuclease/exonuclease/phosphatase family protein [Martelella alba]